MGGFDGGVDAAFGFNARVGGPPGDVQAVECNAFARGFELTIWPAGFEDQGGRSPVGLRFDQVA